MEEQCEDARGLAVAVIEWSWKTFRLVLPAVLVWSFVPDHIGLSLTSFITKTLSEMEAMIVYRTLSFLPSGWNLVGWKTVSLVMVLGRVLGRVPHCHTQGEATCAPSGSAPCPNSYHYCKTECYIKRKVLF